MSESATRNKVAIAGYAHSPIARSLPLSLGAQTARTGREAIADAGLSISDIDGFVTTPLFPTLGSHEALDGTSLVTADWLAHDLGVEPRFIANPAGQVTDAVQVAVDAIASGAARTVLVHRALHNPGGRYHASIQPEAAGHDQWGIPQGHFGPIAAIALAYNEYVQRHGVANDALAPVVVEARKNGAARAWSYWHGKPLDRQDYLAAPFINDPIRKYDCDIPVDGVAAFVLTSAERARDLRHRPVHVTACVNMSPPRLRTRSHWPLDDMMEAGRAAMETLCRRGQVSLDEIDDVQAYDGFAPLVFFWMELTRLCPPGEAHRMVADGGIDSDRPGTKPVLASGGSLGNGRMHGTVQMLECYLQLSRRAGERQRPASLSLACQGIPHMGGAALYSADPF